MVRDEQELIIRALIQLKIEQVIDQKAQNERCLDEFANETNLHCNYRCRHLMRKLTTFIQ